MPGLTIEEKKRRAKRPPEIETGATKRSQKKRGFDELYRALLAFKKEHSHCSVPLRYANDRALGQWVLLTRSTQGMRLTREQKAHLDEIGFDWETRKEKDERRWNEMLTKLKVYKQSHGDCRVPQNWASDPQLSIWVASQREKEANGKLQTNYKQKLESIGFTWRQRTLNRDSSTEDKKWLKKYKRLVEFHSEHGHCLVVSKAKGPHDELAEWVGKQRQAYRNGKLMEERKFLLDGLGFVFKFDKADPSASLTQNHWEEMFQHLVAFKEKYGHVEVNRKFTKWGLGNWVSVQRAEGRKGKLDPRRAVRLQALGLSWGKDWDQRWEEGYAILVKYHKKYGHCRVPRYRPNGKPVRKEIHCRLNNWVKNQKGFEETGVLLPDRKRLLDAIGFPWNNRQSSGDYLTDEDSSSGSEASESEEETSIDGVSLLQRPTKKLRASKFQSRRSAAAKPVLD